LNIGEEDITSVFLSLLLPSYIVAPIRDLENIVFDTLTLHSIITEIASIEDINMADGVYNKIFDTIGNLGTKEVRGRSLDASVHRSRSPSISLSEDEEEYHV